MEAAEQIAVVWKQVRGPFIVPLLRASVMVCLAMCVILFVEKVYMAVVIVAMRMIGRRPERQWRWGPLRDDDPELGNEAYPMVLVQIPMYNEREVSTVYAPQPSRGERECADHVAVRILLSWLLTICHLLAKSFAVMPSSDKNGISTSSTYFFFLRG